MNKIAEYDHQKIEPKWQKRWEENKIYQTKERRGSNNYYCLVEFPYPSSDGLHVGHPRSYTAIDIIARKRRLEGKSVLFPMGFDAFGLPTENYAIKVKRPPQDITKENIATFKRQLKSLGFSFDWSRAVNTSDPKYYKWTQWLFLQLYKAGLVYQAEMPINWCPSCKIGLANEEVIDGQCERCGTAVAKKKLKQWMFKITKYAQRLIDDLAKVDYLDKIKTQQINWIGRSDGASVEFPVFAKASTGEQVTRNKKQENSKLQIQNSKLLIGTKNSAKKKRYANFLKEIGVDVVGQEDLRERIEVEIEEGEDIEENAINKARAYFKATNIPTIAVDEAFYIDKFSKEKQPGSHVRRIPGSKNERPSDKELIDYYQKELNKIGGESSTYWEFAVAFVDGKTEKVKVFKTSSSKIVYQPSKAFKKGYPLDSLQIDLKTGKYRAELSEQEEKEALSEYIEKVREFVSKSLSLDSQITNHESRITNIKVFTTRPDTLFGVTYMVLSPEHELIHELENSITNLEEVKKYIKKAQNKSDLERTELQKEKTGVELKGIKAVNPANNEEIPVWVADYVLASYGTGAIMAVPGHDERDNQFVDYINNSSNIDEKIEIRKVIQPTSAIDCWRYKIKPQYLTEYERNQYQNLKTGKMYPVHYGIGASPKPIVFTGDGFAIKSGPYNGLSTAEFKKKINKWLEQKKIGKAEVQYKLRDWVFSRQHYWGEPIPLIHCDTCRKSDKKTIIIIHGTGSYSQSNWYPWLAEELRELGHEVIVPDMPETKKPILEDWLTELDKYRDKLNKNSVVIGHSIGGRAALHFVAKLNKKIGKLILVAPTNDNMNWRNYAKEHPNDPYIYQQKFNQAEVQYEKVNNIAKKIIYYYSDNDVYIPISVPADYKKVLKADFIKLSGRNHFSIKNGNADTFPELYEEVTEGNSFLIGFVPVPEKDLPVELPMVKNYEPTDNGESPLAKISEWVNVKCPKCSGPAKRETDTMPNWAGSNWYYLRYCDPHNDKEFAAKKKLNDWLPVDLYNGGMEHTTLHLLYSRFWHKALYDLKLVPGAEPYQRRISQGIILAEDGQKMSKSRGNVINPDDIVREYGADTLRLYLMFVGPYAEPVSWSTTGILGIKRFLERVWGLFNAAVSEKTDKDVEHLLNKTIKKVGEDIDQLRFNTAVSALMILVNAMQAKGSTTKQREQFLIMLSLFSPHIAEELWQKLGHKDSIFKEKWPAWDKELIKEEQIDFIIQVNGRLRARLLLPAGVTENEARAQARQHPNVIKHINKTPKKVIFVKGKLINFVV
ncbi:MAG: non-canonical purine NTP pyrophosphatase [Patescibacteria group bacterium]